MRDTTAPTRERAVLDWIGLVEDKPWLDEFFDDLIVDDRLAPGVLLLVGPAPLLPLELGVDEREDDDPYSVDPAAMTLTERMRWIGGLPR